MPSVTPENISHVLDEATKAGASDIQFKSNQPPLIAKNGQWMALAGYDSLTEALVTEIHAKLCRDPRYQHIPQEGCFDADYRTATLNNNFRVSAGKEQGRPYLVLRPLPREIPNFSSLRLLDDSIGAPSHTVNLTEGFQYVMKQKRGLVLVTGPTGSGKSTTLASLINYVNSNRQYNIITIEDPIEFQFRSKQSHLIQREVGVDTGSFELALRAALRQKPDIILVGEMRDQETMNAAFRAASTGHLVLSTLHNNEVAATIERIINEFPPEQQNRAQHSLSEVLVGIFAQQLVPTLDGGRQVIHEALIVTPPVRAMLRPKPDGSGTGGYQQLVRDHVKTKNAFGSRLMDAELKRAVREGLISEEVALEFAIQPENLFKED